MIIKFLKILYRKFKRKIFDLLFKNPLMKYSEYRKFMNKFYRLFFNDPFSDPKKKNLIAHKNNLYFKTIKFRSKSKKYINNSINSFNINLDNNFDDFFKVDIKKMTSVNGSRFSSGWDPLCNTALQLINNQDIKIENLFLYKYFKSFHPKNLSEVFLINKKSSLDKLNPYNRFYPWHTPYPPPEHQDFFFGPKINYKDEIKLRTYRLKNIYELIKTYGYIPDEIDCIEGYVLTNENDYRFIVTAGHHRSGVLSAMNILGNYSNEVTVRFDQERISNKCFIINKKEVKNWPSVKNNFLSEEDAILMFDSYFKDKIYFN